MPHLRLEVPEEWLREDFKQATGFDVKKLLDVEPSGKLIRCGAICVTRVIVAVVPGVNDGVMHEMLLPEKKHCHPTGMLCDT